MNFRPGKEIVTVLHFVPQAALYFSTPAVNRRLVKW
jgi:hypothetical protein